MLLSSAFLLFWGLLLILLTFRLAHEDSAFYHTKTIEDWQAANPQLFVITRL